MEWALLILGLVLCFAGYPLYRVVLLLVGFLLGFAFVQHVLSQFFETPELWVWIGAFMGGVLGACMMLAVHGLALFVIGCLMGGYVAGWFFDEPLYSAHAIWVVLIVVLFGILGVHMARYMIIGFTASMGALYIGMAIGIFLDGSDLAGVPVHGAYLPSLPAGGLFTLGVLAISMIGICFQFRLLDKRRTQNAFI